jgi:hypothetical protein
LPSGKVSYAYRRNGKWLRLGLHGALTCEEARKAALVAAGEVAAGNAEVIEAVTGDAPEDAAIYIIDAPDSEYGAE